MATAKKLPSGSWTCRVYSHTETVDGKEKSVYQRFTAPTKKEAEFRAAEYALNKTRRRNPANLTVKEAISGYIDAKRNILSPSTIVGYVSLEKRAFSEIDITIAKLNNDILQRYFNKMSTQVSPKTLRNMSGLLSASIYYYAPDFVYRVSLPAKRSSEIEIPEADEIKMLMDAAKGYRILLPVMLASGMGLRRSEISGLTVGDVNKKKKTLSINSAVVQSENKEWVTKGTKTNSGKRTLSIPEYIYPTILDATKDKNKEDSLTGMTPSAISSAYNRLIENSGVTRYTFHSLRHYYASMMLANNVPSKYAVRRMGHATDDMLKRVYQHIMSEKDIEVTDVINEYLNNAFGGDKSYR
ncbi:site-specific integrase [Anaerotignum propionicum]|uniref:site-specific integrase n=1 Tax=Anaerotignum propionicum TaxID=28446 RepID=UPI00210972BE|nr:site-specific integrase [Anaerotignum propionicum]MCQ4936735.1 site-specific integrase [Anaerotignum propionicum]